jgi:hypothetical protein
MRTFVALRNFTIPIKGMEVIEVSKGEEIQYDGFVAIVRDVKISTKALCSTIGDWIALQGQEKNINNKVETVSRNATGGRIIENNDPSYDSVYRKKKSDDLETLLKEQDKISQGLVVDDEKDLKKENQKKRIYEVYEEQEVKKINKDDKNNTNIKQKESTEIIKDNIEVKEIVKKEKVENKPKKLKVDKEATGEVYKETKFDKDKNKDKNENKTKQKVFTTNVAVKEKIEDNVPSKIDVVSSTVSPTETKKEKKIIKEESLSDAVVVTKTRNIELEDDILKEVGDIISDLKIGKEEETSVLIDDEAIVEDNDIDLSNILD